MSGTFQLAGTIIGSQFGPIGMYIGSQVGACIGPEIFGASAEAAVESPMVEPSEDDAS
ncbi:hypothetical protein DFR24_0679 [Panacagrimonas perspica]|uniref:Uncharacterized protein n=1 Tax=Panacagrimonas perspica TaxID=381431 RepID=A0A4R7PB58_9GAMM|nr:hypothetical protein [Panacagrimonas perspica]TDU31315.1 hypothetical protein DFR24_0679 [Panacagrimonas perspica]